MRGHHSQTTKELPKPVHMTTVNMTPLITIYIHNPQAMRSKPYTPIPWIHILGVERIPRDTYHSPALLVKGWKK
jgi:hypothetical protein